MKKLVIFALVIAALVWGGRRTYARHEENETLRLSQARVEKVLKFMKGGSGAGADIQTAVCLWAENKIFIADRDQLSAYSDQFDRWRAAKKLYRSFERWEVMSAEYRGPVEAKTVVVTVSIEGGKPLKVLVPPGAALEWTR